MSERELDLLEGCVTAVGKLGKCPSKIMGCDGDAELHTVSFNHLEDRLGGHRLTHDPVRLIDRA